MNSEVISKTVGPLKQHDYFSDWWISNSIEIPFFDNKKLSVTFMSFEPETDLAYMHEADEALACFISLTGNDRALISDHVYRNFSEVMEWVGEESVDAGLVNIKEKGTIWNFVDPTAIYISRRPYNDKDLYVVVACECAWEKEHGLQLVFRRGKKLTRVSDQDGHLTDADAKGKADDEDVMLAGFNN